MADDLELELMIRLNVGNVFSDLEREAKRVGDRIEEDLKAAIARGLKGGASTKIPMPPPGGGGTGGSRQGRSGGTAGARSTEVADAKKLLELQLQYDRARLASARIDGSAELRKELAIRVEMAQQAQRLAQIKASGVSPDAAKEAERLAIALNKVNLAKINSQYEKSAAPRNTEVADARKLLELEMQLANARSASARIDGSPALRRELAIQVEMTAHAQRLAKIKASPISPEAAQQAEKLAIALNKINVAKISADFDNLGSKSSASLGKLSSVLTGLLAGVTAAAASAGIGAITSGITGAVDGVTGAIASSSRAVVDFNGTLNTLKVNTSATVADMEATRQAVLDTSMAFGQMPQVTAEVALALGRAGVSAERMPEYLRNAGQAATATGEDFQLAADTIRQLADVFTAEDLNSLTDIATVAANISPAGFQAINQAVAYGAGAAKSAGVAFKDFAASVVQLNMAGMDGSSAGTSLTALYKDVTENSKAFEAIGVEVFDKVSGQQRNMNQIIDEAVIKLSEMSDAQRAIAVKPLDDQSVRALRTLGDAALNSAEKVETLKKALNDSSGFSASNATAMMNDPSQQFKQILAGVDSLKISLGTAMEPAIAGGARFGVALVEALNKNKGLFDQINQASQRFADFLAQNPELVNRLAAELAEVANTLGGVILAQAQRLIEYLEQNPQAIQEGVDALGGFAESLGTCVEFGVALVEMFAGLADGVLAISDTLGGWEQSIRDALGPAQALVDVLKIASNPAGALAQYQLDRVRGVGGEQAPTPPPAPTGLTAAGQQAYQLSQTPEVRALLDTITLGEGTAGDKGYNTMFGGGTFSSNADHPRQLISGGGYTSDAAGRYQFLSTTWDEIAGQLGLTDFSPQSQDIAATYLAQRRGAIAPLQQGDLGAVRERLAPEWASIPMANGQSYYGQPAIAPMEFDETYRQNLGAQQSRAQGGMASAMGPAGALLTSAIAGNAVAPRPGSNEQYGPSLPGQQTSAARRNSTPQRATPYGVDQTFYIDDSPVGSYDFTLNQPGAANDGYRAAIPSPTRGTVSDAGFEPGYGNFLSVQGEDGMTWFMAHLDEVAVKVGEVVERGVTLGYQGTTGSSTGEHIHLELTRDLIGGMANQIQDRSVTKPLVDAYIQSLTEGTYAAGGVDTTATTQATAQQRAQAERDRLQQQLFANEDAALQQRRETERQQQDAQAAQQRLELQAKFAPLEGGPLAGFGQQTLAAFDLRQQYQPRMTENSQRLEDLRTERERLSTGPEANQPGMDDRINAIDEAIAAGEELNKQLGETYRLELANLEATNERANAEARLQQQITAQARAATDAARELQLNNQEYLSRIEDPNLQSFAAGQLQAQTIDAEYEQQIQAVRVEADKLAEALQVAADAGLDINNPEYQIRVDELESLEEHIQSLNRQREIELRITLDGAQRALRELSDLQEAEILQSEVSVLQGRGDVYGANRVQRAAATEAETERFRNRQSEILQYAPPEQQQELLAQNEQLNSFNLEGIGQQFKTLREDIDSVAIEGFGQFTQSLGKMIMDGEFSLNGFLDVVGNFADTMINKLLEVGTNSLIGSLFGGSSGVAQGGGGLGGVLMDAGTGGGGGGLLGGVIDLIAADGYNPYQSGIANFAKGSLSDEIESALRRESMQSGLKPKLAVINEEEIVLSAQQSRRFMRMGLDQVVNYAEGNIPPQPAVGRGSIGTNSMQFNIPVTVNAGSREDGNAIAAGLPRALRSAVEAVVDDRIAKSGRARSQIRRQG